MNNIQLENVCKSYHGVPVLRDLTVQFPAGQVSCIMGPSGIGKTTLLRILMGLEHPDSGHVTGLSGQRISAVFQEDRLCPWLTALDNLRLVTPSLTKAAALDALAALGLGEDGNRPVRELSGGMRRRTALLRALLAEYDLLLLDEPFKGLDADTKARTVQTVRERTMGKTVLLVTHDPDEPKAIAAACVFTL